MEEPSARVLVVDDEPQIRRFLGISLRAQGYEAVEAADGQSALAALAAGGIDAVVLDLGLPDMDGRDVLRDLRDWSKVPVVVLSARAREEEKVALLDAGANDYVTKPFGVQELMARLRVLLRPERDAEPPAALEIDDLVIDLPRRSLSVGGELVTLTRKEWALLALLLRHRGRVLTQSQLLRELWGPTHAEDTHYLRILVAKLRAKLRDSAAEPRYIVTEPGVGLRFLD
jgi:two-component system KDP operon response regulator KdpE